ncbi:hypothetical protein QAD02_018695 [Eretmocerus hayati]|uniref:Uncharacterized protein n=1 Tax=Eretmocerus hayati TaxID=131215 RepID=A0ACC2PIP6_9HYME|nr:hypothetical protein QAD02_018695 [Eretmocerus hayati]
MEELALECEDVDISNTIDFYKCNQCSELFPNKDTLKDHQTTHGNNQKNYCLSCEKQFKSSYEIRYHNCIKKFLCSICGDTLGSLQSKKKHELEHYHEDNGHLCATCGEKFQHEYNLIQHCKSHHFKSIKKFSCSRCPRKFKYKSRLDHHSRTFHSTGEFHSCPDCNAHFKTSRILQQHLIHKHSGINAKVKCLECDLQVSVHNLRKHVDSHKVQEKKVPVLCHQCNQEFATQELLKYHEKKCHIKCESCDSTFTSRFIYKNHRMITHGDEENKYSCPHCPKVFISQSKRTRHLVTHSSIAPIKCDLCGFRTNFGDDLEQHKLMKHNNERSLKCEKCPWTFKRKCDLFRHGKTHIKEKVYSYCKYCPKKFEYLSNKTKHEKKYHSSSIPKPVSF